MKKTLLCFAVLAVFCLPSAAEPSQTLGLSQAGLPAVSLETLRGQPPASVPGVPVPVSAFQPPADARWVGYVSLKGYALASVGIHRIRLKVSGKMNVVDENGVIVLPNVPVAYEGSFQVEDRYIYGYAQLEAPVSRLVEGRVAQRGVLRGAVKMQGFISAGTARIRGNGQISGVVASERRP